MLLAVLVSGDGRKSMGYRDQSSYSRGNSDFRPARCARINVFSAELISHWLSALVFGGGCPGIASPSKVETYGVTSGPVRPKREKSPCGFAHSSGITMAISAGAGDTWARSNWPTIFENFLNSVASGLSCRSQAVIPHCVSCGVRRYGALRYCCGDASV